MEHLQNRRFWLGGGAFAALLIVAVAYFLFISPERSSANDLRVQTAATEQQNSVLQAKVKQLELKSTQLGTYTTALRAALAALPFDSGLPAFTRQLASQATNDGVTVSSVTVGGVTAVGAGAATTPTTTDSTSTATPAATPTTTTTTAPVATTAAGGLFSVQVTVQSSGTLAHQLKFITDIRIAGARRALVTATQVAPGSGAKAGSIDGASSVTTSITIFSAPQTPDQIALLNKLLSGKIGS